MKYILGIASLIFLLGSCQGDLLYKKQLAIAEKGWSKEDTLHYDFELNDTTARYNMTLEVEALSAFRYQNLYVSMRTLFPDGSTGDDIVSLEMVSPSGIWNGKCNGEVCTVPILIQENIGIKKAGKYQLNITQYSRQDTIRGVKSLTLAVSRAKES
ncbi:MAG: gliding motility lipoprotein GldH [Saprospiraceae bacterium]|nr:gliding motility lipoprotein GldH [Saprospiraceae bacterium]